MIKPLLIIAIIILLQTAGAQSSPPSVGDIAFDAKTDDPKFQFCHTVVYQGYELKTPQDESRRWISAHIKERFSYNEAWKNETGFVTVRFAVNCLGLTDRFRVTNFTRDLMPGHLTPDFCNYLTQLVKDEKWPIGTYHLQTLDYYTQVTFKIVNGKLLEVLL